MRLLIVTQAVDSSDPILGFFHRWIEEFAKHAERVHVIALKEGEHELPANVTVHSLGKERGRPTLGGIVYAWRFLVLAWNLRREYDAVFVHMNPEYVVLGGPLWRLSGKRIGLWYVHGSVTIPLWIATRFSHRVFSASQESFPIPTATLVACGHGIDAADPKRAERSSKAVLRILTVGRISRIKHTKEMLSALDELKKRDIGAMLSIVGVPVTDDDRAYEREIRREYGARNDVVFEGAILHAKVPEHLARSDVFLNLSATGGMDKAVLEALAAGVPAVSSNETFRSMLGPFGLFIASRERRVVADALVRACDTDISSLVAEVRVQHSLQTLVPRILEKLEL